MGIKSKERYNSAQKEDYEFNPYNEEGQLEDSLSHEIGESTVSAKKFSALTEEDGEMNIELGQSKSNLIKKFEGESSHRKTGSGRYDPLDDEED
jgi:hypothetical protein